MSETEAVKGKRGRPKKEATVETVAEVDKGFFGKAKDSIMSLVPAMNATNKDAFKKLGVGAAVAGADAALVYVKDNISTVNFGGLDALVKSLLVVGIGEARNMLRGGPVSADVFLEAVQTELGKLEKLAEDTEDEEKKDE